MALPIRTPTATHPPPEVDFGLGLVTYQWGRDWDLPTLLGNCAQTGFLAVELRTGHRHGVEPSLTALQRDQVAKQFADSPVNLVGLGSNERFDHPDPAQLQAAIESGKQYVQLSHDVGGSGVKVKPDSFHPDIDRARTIEQIGNALNQLAEFSDGLGQQVRLEVHGQCAPLPLIAQIMQVADHPGVGVCWNSNPQDLDEPGLEHNFALVAGRLALSCHVHELDGGQYPYDRLFELLAEARFAGWVLLEASSHPEDLLQAMRDQRSQFDQFVSALAKTC